MANNEERLIRSFVAVDLPMEVKGRLSRLVESLRRGGHPVKWVNPQGLHVTLKFLGNVEASRIPAVSQAVEQVAHDARSFELTAVGLGTFPSLSRPRVVWVGLEGAIDELQRLQSALEAALSRLGFAPENRPFSPHLTLGRVQESTPPDQRRAFGSALAATKIGQLGSFTVRELVLMESKLSPQGARYSALCRAPFSA